MFKKLLLIQFFLFAGYCSIAQIPILQKSQIENIKVDDLTDDQIRRIVAEMKKNGISFSEIDTYAASKGFKEGEVDKLKTRIQALGLDKELTGRNVVIGRDDDSADRNIEDANDKLNIDSKLRTDDSLERNGKKIFGSDLFSNKNLTFEPNLRIPTPPNYRLAAGDEILIDVYGYSEVQHKLKVTPEGYIRIPNLGPVYVSGLTVEEAKVRITKQLSAIYSGISSGNTFVQISLGDIRSITVLLIGEIRSPGTYTLPSLATIANALYVSGGPNDNGSFRDISLVRHGQIIATFDLYDFLIRGDLSNNLVLQDQDIIKVNSYRIRVELSGQVKHPAIFEAKQQESLQQIIDYAGGYTDIAFKDQILGYRVNRKQRELINISEDQINTFKVKSGDQFFVDSILNRFTNLVSISGALFHPGNYALEKDMTLLDLIKKADGVKEAASLSRGYIKRLNPDYTPAIINFNLNEILAGTKTISLQREDSVVVFSKSELHEEYYLTISGEVNKPGIFTYADSTHLEDLILMAGGLSDAASLQRVEVSRRIRGNTYDSANITNAIVTQIDINGDLSKNKEQMQFVLQPYDEVIVRKQPAYNKQTNVSIGGEIVYPGVYAIQTSRERISDLIKRAGGLKESAYPDGAILMRQTYASTADSILLSSKLEIFYNKLQDSSDIARFRNVVNRKDQLVGIDLNRIMKEPGSKYDLYLENGDRIQVSKKFQTVQTFGEIYFPKKIRYDKANTFRDYISGSGGFTSSAMKRRSYIVFPNGEVKNTKKIFFFNKYPKVTPGSQIYVPTKREKKGLSGQEIIGLSSGIASVALIIVTILTRVK